MKNFFLILTFLISRESFSQSYELIQSISIDKPTEVSIDQGGNIYFATFNGDIIRYDPLLKNRLIFSPGNPTTATVLEAWQGLRIFIFHRDLQQYRLINRNLSLHEDYSFPPELIGFVEIATPSYDNNIWLIDQVDFSLIKYNINSKTVASRTPLNQLLISSSNEIMFCKEYQNRLFISTKNYGILIFDNFGNYIKTFQYPGVSSFNFWKDNMYFISENKLVNLNLYNEESFTEEISTQTDWLFALIFENRLYLFSEKQLILYIKKNPH